ncbi:hypothetical protein NGH33_01925 [Micrococcus yunnanensis]|nr:hypothetical protein [Micrococcus yunnanensis]MCO0632733.1 hypothetical protein [Micrococcus yunnanensis]
MTRPMPGPAEHDRMSWPHVGAPTSCDLCAALRWPDDKHLTHAECAAEYWQASYHLARPLAANTFVPTPEWDRTRQEAATWFRFATTPHEGSPQ